MGRGLVVAASALLIGCGHCHGADASVATCLVPVLVADRSAPKQAGPAFDVPKRPLETAGLHYRFTMPYGFTRDPESKKQLFRDEQREHAVRIEVTEFTGSPADFFTERYPDGEQYTLKLGVRDVPMVTVAGSYRRVTAVALAREGKMYELACSQDVALIGEGPDATCLAVLKTFTIE